MPVVSLAGHRPNAAAGTPGFGDARPGPVARGDPPARQREQREAGRSSPITARARSPGCWRSFWPDAAAIPAWPMLAIWPTTSCGAKNTMDILSAGRAEVAAYLEAAHRPGPRSGHARPPPSDAARVLPDRGRGEPTRFSPTRRLKTPPVTASRPPRALPTANCATCSRPPTKPAIRVCGPLPGCWQALGPIPRPTPTWPTWTPRPAARSAGRHRKGQRPRRVLLHPEVHRRLQPLRRRTAVGAVRHPHRPSLGPQQRGPRPQCAGGRANRRTVRPTTLRHTFVTLARQTDCGLQEVQDAVGHADVRTTRGYDHTVLTARTHPAWTILRSIR